MTKAADMSNKILSSIFPSEKELEERLAELEKKEEKLTNTDKISIALGLATIAFFVFVFGSVVFSVVFG